MGKMSIPMIGFVLLCLWAMVAKGEYMKYKDPKQPLGMRIKDLMKRMTLEEKIGQMTQIERKVATPDVMKQTFIESISTFKGGVSSYSATRHTSHKNKWRKGGLRVLVVPLV